RGHRPARARLQEQALLRADPQAAGSVAHAAHHVGGGNHAGAEAARHAVGADDPQAVGGGKPHLVAAAVDPPRVDGPLRLGRRYAADRAVRLAHEYAVAAADPQSAAPVHIQCGNGADLGWRGTKLRIDHVLEAALVRVHAVEPAGAAYPQAAVRCLRDGPDPVAGQAGRVGLIVPPVAEAAAGLVVAVQAGVEASGPQASAAIDRQRGNAVGVQRARVVLRMPEHLEADAVETRQATLGAEPDRALAILHHGVDIGAWQAIRGVVAAKLR